MERCEHNWGDEFPKPCAICNSTFGGDTGKDADRQLSYSVIGYYESDECPDCHDPIPLEAVEGDECVNCGHVFYQFHEDDGQPSDLQENKDFAHDGYFDNIPGDEIL